MNHCNILSQGDKIKLLREKYNLTQEDIAGNDVTRNLISEIETSKVNLSRNTAEIILRNLRKLASLRKLQVDETIDYLLEGETEQVSRVLDKYIEELKIVMVYRDNSFLDTLKEAEEFLVRWDFRDKKIAIYELAGDYYCNQNELNRSIVYYEKALALMGKFFLTPGLLNLLLKLSKSYGNAGRYSESIDCCNFALEHFENLTKDHKIRFIYNHALTFEKLGNFQRAVVDIEKIQSLLDKEDVRTYFSVLDTKAVCLYELKRYDEALDLYNNVLNILDDKCIDKKIVIHINMAEVYIRLSNTAIANELLDKVKEELPFINNDSFYEANIYYELGKIYRWFNEREKSFEYYANAIEVGKKRNNYNLVTDILYELMEIQHSIEEVNSIKNEVLLISSKQEKLADKLIHRLIDFYADNNVMSSIKEINNFALKFV